MKNKKRIILVASLLGAMVLGIGALTSFIKNNKSMFLHADTGECAYHHGNHYAAKAPTATESGWQEFWACCECHHQYIGSAPAGDWVNLDAQYMVGGVNSDHIAYLAPTGLESKLKTAVFADIQLCYKEKGTGFKANVGSTAHAYLALRNHFQLCKEQNVDVIFMNGDITNEAVEKYYQLYEDTFEEVYGTDDSKYPEIIWNMGNHEWWGYSGGDSADAVTMFKRYARIETPNLVAKSNVRYSLNNSETLPTYYKVVNGVPFIAISGENSNGLVGNEMANEIAGWLQDISNLPSVQNGGPIYVAYHYALSTSLTHGNGSLSYSSVVEDLFKDYPQAIIFTGDTHYPGVNERSINQVNFTTINIGSSSYSRMEKMSATMTEGEHYYNMASSSGKTSDIPTGNANFKFEYTPTIHFMETMNDESTVINRYFSADDVNDATHINGAWTIPAYSSPSNFEYTNARFENTDYAHDLYGANGVSWANNAEVKFGVKDGQMTVHFPDTNQYHYTEHFKIEVTGNTTKTYDVVSNYYKYSANPENLYFVLKDLPTGSSYSVKVTAYDYFDNPSLNYLTSNTNDVSVCADDIDEALVNTYCDISGRMNFEDTVPNSNTSIEYYYNGPYSFAAGAVLNRPILDEGDNASDFISIGDNNDCEIIVRTKVKNLTNDTLTIGLIVVDDKGSWLSDFSAPTRKAVGPNSDWTSLEWNLTSLYNLVGRSGVSSVGLKASSSGYNAEGYTIHFLMDDTDVAAGEYIDNSRGDLFTSGTNYTLDLSTPLSLSDTIYIDFKFTSSAETYVHFMLSHGWNDYLGYYKLFADGRLEENYSGVSVSTLEDGYYRVTVVISELNKVGGGSIENITDINMFYIRGNWSDASGYVDFDADTMPGVIRGETLTAGVNFSRDIQAIPLTETIIIDFKFTSGKDTYANMVLGDGWSNYYGYYRINANGTLGGNYAGVSITELPDGYYRVSFVLSQLSGGQNTNLIEKINLIHIRGSTSNASGYVDINPSI